MEEWVSLALGLAAAGLVLALSLGLGWEHLRWVLVVGLALAVIAGLLVGCAP